MTKDEALALLYEFEDAAIATYTFTNGINRHGKLESKIRREVKAAKGILKHLTKEEVTDQDIKDILY